MPRAISNQGGSNLPEDLLPLGLVLRVGEQAFVVQVFKAKQAGLQVVGGGGGAWTGGASASEELFFETPTSSETPRSKSL